MILIYFVILSFHLCLYIYWLVYTTNTMSIFLAKPPSSIITNTSCKYSFSKSLLALTLSRFTIVSSRKFLFFESKPFHTLIILIDLFQVKCSLTLSSQRRITMLKLKLYTLKTYKYFESCVSNLKNIPKRFECKKTHSHEQFFLIGELQIFKYIFVARQPKLKNIVTCESSLIVCW